MNNKKTHYDCIILGAGGAGLMCAAIAGQNGRKVLLLDHAEKPGKKILISGGGRCNFTNIHTSSKNYLSKNPHFAKSALARYTPHDFIALIEKYNIAWHEKTLGQLFCDGSAKQVVDMFLDECGKGGVDLQLEKSITHITHSDNRFLVEADQEVWTADNLVIATGGQSIPKMGATGFAYDLARQFKMKVVEPKPALVPFTLGEEGALFKSLSGLSAEVIAKCNDMEFREAALFTHKGLSGPAILQISSYWKHGDDVGIDFLPAQNQDWLLCAKRGVPRMKFPALLSTFLPDRLAEALVERMDYSDIHGDLANMPDKLLTQITEKLHGWKFCPNGTEGFAKAEVTIGGISTDELSSKTMESKKVPGLYCIGEAVDVTGWLGGYNFQWAWASGYAAGMSI